MTFSPVQESTRVAFRFVLMAFMLAGFFSAQALADEKNFNGHYELANAKSDRSFSLDIKQKDKDDRAAISFTAAMTDGSGAAPDATGKGDVDDGILSFKFKDSYNNEGTGTLAAKKTGTGYVLSMTVTKVVDSAPFHFYGSMVLVQTKK